ncbi:MAG: hypothetical protein HY815_04245 [Candidatus Riflebacteria bacterium]|nr:hypothetical protein [Candidatus Riflebacteria bacterium]
MTQRVTRARRAGGAGGRVASARPGSGDRRRFEPARRGLSVAELVVVSATMTVLLGVLMSLWASGTLMNRAAQSSVALQNAMILEETIYQDFQRMGVDLDSVSTHLVSRTCLSFYRVAFDGPWIRLRPVRYSRIASPGGLYFLKRTEIGPGGRHDVTVFSGVPLLDVRFEEIVDPVLKRRYLSVYLLASEADRRDQRPRAALRDRTGCRSLVARVPMPAMLRNPIMEPVTKIATESGTGLLPLEG